MNKDAALANAPHERQINTAERESQRQTNCERDTHKDVPTAPRNTIGQHAQNNDLAHTLYRG